MRPETKEFIDNWELKLSQIVEADGKLKELYDKFITLYTIYNRYYNEAFFLKEQAKELTKPRYSDYEKATSFLVNYLGSQLIIDKIKEDKIEYTVDHACKLIENKIFHINLANGEPKEETDEQLLKNLRDEDANIRAKAITSLIYNVRCNIVHGYKDFQEYQRMLVEPLVELLQLFVNLFKEKIYPL